jgi:hypothetical protein
VDPDVFTLGMGGTVRADLSSEERELVSSLARQVSQLISERSPSVSDPAIARLLPAAYLDDAAAEEEFRRFTEDDLAAAKFRNAELVIAMLSTDGPLELGPDAVQAWLRTLTDIRLTLAARLGINADDDHGDVSTDHGAMLRDVYDWLGYLQESLVRTLER